MLAWSTCQQSKYENYLLSFLSRYKWEASSAASVKFMLRFFIFHFSLAESLNWLKSCYGSHSPSVLSQLYDSTLQSHFPPILIFSPIILWVASEMLHRRVVNKTMLVLPQTSTVGANSSWLRKVGEMRPGGPALRCRAVHVMSSRELQEKNLPLLHWLLAACGAIH